LKVLGKEKEKEQLKADIKKAREEEKRVNRDCGGANLNTEKSKAEYDHLKMTHEVQKMECMGYHYMLDRMKRDLISLNLTINDLTDSLKSKQTITDDELAK
jgi:Spy/CpxP family protein refolding chaperone